MGTIDRLSIRVVPQVLPIVISLTIQDEARDFWQHIGFTEAVPIAFHTAPDSDGLRNAIKKIIVQKGAQLADDPTFEMIVGDIEGLGFALSKQKCHSVANAQRVCPNCSSTFLSQCASEGCATDEDGRCKHCRGMIYPRR